jgi:DNA-binding response OmpR family regulator/signal transduction histidine kinase
VPGAAPEPARVLVVDDEATIRALLSGSLRFAGFEVVTASSGAEAVRAAACFRPDLILLDVMMPHGDGFEVARRLRAGPRGIPVVFLTARDQVADRVAGLNLGGDDYVTKPFSLDEVLARVRAVLNRAREAAPCSRLRVADLELDEDAHEVRRAGHVIALTPTEFRLLRFLMANAGRVVSRSQIRDHVWEYGQAGDGNLVESCVSYLRRKVDQREPQLIHTVRGLGYVLPRRLPGGEHEVVAYSLDDLDHTVIRLEIADTLAGAIAVALLAATGLPLVRASLSPLAAIEGTAAAIASGDLTRRIDHPSEKTEVGQLSRALETMLATIEAAYEARASGEEQARRSESRMRQFAADASHELRIPLTSVRGLAEYGLQQGDHASNDELLRLMTMIQREADRMSRLVEDLLLLAHYDAGRPFDLAPVDLASIAAEAAQQARAVHPARVITLHAAEPAVVMADAGRIRQVIDNLIGNALQHRPPESPVTITVTGVPGAVQLIVADQGPGMTAEQASHVFERFYRTDQARTRARGGTGLGLAIAASLTTAHGGHLSVDTQPGHGAAFHLRFPVADSHQEQPATSTATS